MSINLTDEIEVKTKKGKLGAAKQIFLEGDMQNVEKEIQDINSRHSALNTKHESLSRTVQGIAATGGASTANNVTYNNNASGLNAENVQDAINELVTSLKAEFSYKGIAQPTTNPGVPDRNVFYIAGEGSYPNFNNQVVEIGQIAVLKWDGSWHKEILEIGSGGGNIILDWNTDVKTTRKQVKAKFRKQLLQISYKNVNGDIVNEQYVGKLTSDTEWIKDSNWEQIPNQTQILELKDFNFNMSKGSSFKSLILKDFQSYIKDLVSPYDLDGIISIENKYIKSADSLQGLSLVSHNVYRLFVRKTYEGEVLDFNLYIRDTSIISAIVYCTDNDITTAVAQYNTYNADNRIIKKITTPANANYIFFCFDTREKQNSYIQYEYNISLMLDSNTFNKTIAEKSTFKDITYDIDYQNGYFVNGGGGQINREARYSVSDYIDITNVNGFLVRFAWETSVSPIVFYDENKQIILMYKKTSGSQPYETYIDRSQFPTNAKFVRFCNLYPWAASDPNNKLVPGGFKLFIGLLVNDSFNSEFNGYCANYWKKGDKATDLVINSEEVNTANGYPLSAKTFKINRNFFGFSRYIERFTFAFDDENSKVKIIFGLPGYLDKSITVVIDFTLRQMKVGQDIKDIPSNFGISECSLIVNSENDRSYVKLINGVCETILFENVPIYHTGTTTTLTGYESNTKILNYSCNIPIVDVMFGGDSITYGVGVTTNANLCWALFAKDNPNISVGAYAAGGQKINWFWKQRYYISHYIKPKYIVFNYGANGGNSIDLFNQIQEYFKFYGIGIIINHITNANNTDMQKQQTDANNAVIKEWLASHAIIKHSARYDLCTSIDGIYKNGADSSTLNDGLHPNNLGNQRMYERIKSDLPELYE